VNFTSDHEFCRQHPAGIKNQYK